MMAAHLLSQASSDSSIHLNHSLLCNAKNPVHLESNVPKNDATKDYPLLAFAAIAKGDG
jgi:hypothetical protein